MDEHVEHHRGGDAAGVVFEHPHHERLARVNFLEGAQAGVVRNGQVPSAVRVSRREQYAEVRDER